MTAVGSPLQQMEGLNHIFLKREDLLLPGGGNKVRRFQTFFDEHPELTKIVALSNPGSHSFAILKQFYNQERHRQFVFLERKMPMSPYEKSNRETYRDKGAIEVNQAALWIQWLKWMYYKYIDRNPTTGVIGIGGHTSTRINPFQHAMLECNQQLQAYDREGTIMHVFPIASGQMLDGFLEINNPSNQQHLFTGVLTGDRLTYRHLRLKYRSYPNVTLLQPVRHTPKEYEQHAVDFHQKTGVWLDPIHTIHMLDLYHAIRQADEKNYTYILWITCPFLDRNPGYE